MHQLGDGLQIIMTLDTLQRFSKYVWEHTWGFEVLFTIVISKSCFVALSPPKRKLGDFSHGCYILRLRAKTA